eukprot:scaffold12.g7949.t1
MPSNLEDAFGVVNYITLAGETGEPHFLEQADALIQDVHDTLGRDRAGRARLGPATDAEPTLGGLRIGKVHPEGHPDGEMGEWMGGGGQHMEHAIPPVPSFDCGAVSHPLVFPPLCQLVQAVHPHFVAGRGSARPRMFWYVTYHTVWKISIDMSRPAVPSEGNLDPFDGLVTYRQELLREASRDRGTLRSEIADMEAMVANKYTKYRSDDPLDLGEVSPAAVALADWAPRVAALHVAWAPRLLERDADISPVMFCSSLVPGTWERGYEKRLRELARQARGEE